MYICSKESNTFQNMASIKVKFKASSLPDYEGTIFYQILHDRKQRQLYTDYHVFPYEWNERRSMIITNHRSARKSFILSIRERIRWDVERLNKIIRKLDNECMTYTVDEIIEEFHRLSNECSLFNFMEGLIIKMKQNGKIRTSETYTSALNSFKKFRNDEDIMLDCINSKIMEAYEGWHQQRGVSLNTISFYTRILRAVYNRAVEEEIIENRHPFRHVYTGIQKTVKRALPLKIMKRIKNLDLSLIPELDFARDMFIMSFMLRGMSFIDMAYLRKTDLADGYITYRRRKTRQLMIIEWTKEMQMILDKYPENKSDYLLPIIRNKGVNELTTYRNVGYNINHNLKRVAKKAGLNIPLTLYVARHSWASVARAKGIPVSVISEGMGHDSETTTKIYLASLDTSVVDKANSIIIKSL